MVDERSEADVLVVGGGAAGCVVTIMIAERLSRARRFLTAAMIQAGPPLVALLAAFLL